MSDTFDFSNLPVGLPAMGYYARSGGFFFFRLPLLPGLILRLPPPILASGQFSALREGNFANSAVN
jgi:hypothetical protein